jgi:NDP-sugar pyrophosphorylase family protein
VNVIAAGTSALDAFWAIQETDGRARVVDGERTIGLVDDHLLRRAHLLGSDLATTPVESLAVDELPEPGPPPVAVVQAGGKGSRLQPLTLKLPKPLLTVGRTTILDRLLEGLAVAAVDEVWISVHYMAEAIEERIGDGGGHGLRVDYLRESTPLGGAGPLALLPRRPDVPMLVLNADQSTGLRFRRMADYHRAEGAAITIGAFTHEVPIPYGVLGDDDGELVSWEEKPTARFRCSAGFYVIDPGVLDLVPAGRASSMPELVAAAQARGDKVVVFPILERWLDIGTPEELEQALLWTVTGEDT